MPRGDGGGEEHDVGVLQDARQVGRVPDPAVEGMRAGEVQVCGMPAIHHGGAQRLGERHQVLDCAHAASDLLGHDHGIARPDEGPSQLVERGGIGGGRMGVAGHGGGIGRHRREQVLHGQRHEDRPSRGSHGELASALDGGGQDHWCVEAKAPLGRAFHEPRRAAHVGQEAQPLMAEVVAVLAEGDGLAGKDDHGHLLVHGRAHGHGRVLGPHRRMEHHGRELAGGLRVTARHPQCDLLVTGREVVGDIARRVVGLGEKLPDRRPLRARRGEDPLHAHEGEHAQKGLGPCHSFRFHVPRLSPWFVVAALALVGIPRFLWSTVDRVVPQETSRNRFRDRSSMCAN